MTITGCKKMKMEMARRRRAGRVGAHGRCSDRFTVSPPAAEDKMCSGCTVYHRENMPTDETLWRLIRGEAPAQAKVERPLSSTFPTLSPTVHCRSYRMSSCPARDSISARTSTQDSRCSDAPTLRACNWMEENLSNFREMPATHTPYRIQSRRLGDFTSGWAASAGFYHLLCVSTHARMGSNGKGIPVSVRLRQLPSGEGMLSS
jgi:hypothetical protein